MKTVTYSVPIPPPEPTCGVRYCVAHLTTTHLMQVRLPSVDVAVT